MTETIHPSIHLSIDQTKMGELRTGLDQETINQCCMRVVGRNQVLGIKPTQATTTTKTTDSLLRECEPKQYSSRCATESRAVTRSSICNIAVRWAKGKKKTFSMEASALPGTTYLHQSQLGTVGKAELVAWLLYDRCDYTRCPSYSMYLTWYSILGSLRLLRQMAHVSAQISHDHIATAFHFLISNRGATCNNGIASHGITSHLL